jgi:hypothetical protein
MKTAEYLYLPLKYEYIGKLRKFSFDTRYYNILGCPIVNMAVSIDTAKLNMDGTMRRYSLPNGAIVLEVANYTWDHSVCLYDNEFMYVDKTCLFECNSI